MHTPAPACLPACLPACPREPPPPSPVLVPCSAPLPHLLPVGGVYYYSKKKGAAEPAKAKTGDMFSSNPAFADEEGGGAGEPKAGKGRSTISSAENPMFGTDEAEGGGNPLFAAGAAGGKSRKLAEDAKAQREVRKRVSSCVRQADHGWGGCLLPVKAAASWPASPLAAHQPRLCCLPTLLPCLTKPARLPAHLLQMSAAENPMFGGMDEEGGANPLFAGGDDSPTHPGGVKTAREVCVCVCVLGSPAVTPCSHA